MFLIVGLGNPGIQYSSTRHNVGFMAVDELSYRHNFILKEKSKYKAEVATGVIQQHNVVLCKPLTYMNLSGQSVLGLAKFYKIKVANIIVIHDEIDLEVAKVKYKFGGGHAGHNGLRSIESCLGDRGFHRIRLGVGRPEDSRFDIADYVLSKFTSSQQQQIDEKIQKITQEIHCLLDDEIDEFKKNCR